MMQHRKAVIRAKVFGWLLPVVAASAVWAHEGVRNPDVMARMDSMVEMKDAFDLLAEMAKGARAFDGAQARAAAQAIADQAARTVPLFQSPANDPKSEARPEIWQRFDDFTQMSRALEQAAMQAARDIDTMTALRAEALAVGKTCLSCHDSYREIE